jgi:Tfp pilus assembly protein PilN
MSTINLLPWREAKRKKLQTQFIMAVVTVAVLALIVWGAGHLIVGQHLVGEPR